MNTPHILRKALAAAAMLAATTLTAFDLTLVGTFTGTTRYVSKSGNDTNGGTSWNDAKLTIQAAVDLCNDGDTVVVDDGEYSDTTTWTSTSKSTETLPTVVQITKRIHLVSRNGKHKTHIVGHWGSDSTGVGSGAARCIFIKGTASKNDAANGTLIEGFTIRDGATEESTAGNTDYDSAGGICGGTGNNGTPILAYVVDCDIANCRAGTGPAMSRNIVPIRCAFIGNRGVNSVKAAHVFYRTQYAYDCVFTGNGSGTRGSKGSDGSIFVNQQTVIIANCTFIDNTCDGFVGTASGYTHTAYNCAWLGSGECATYGKGSEGGDKSRFYPTNCVQTASGTSSTAGGRIAEAGATAGCSVGVSEYQHYFAADTGEWTFTTTGDLKDKGFNARSVAATFVPEEYLDTDFFGNPRNWTSVDIGAIEAQGDAADPALGYIRLGTNVAVRAGTTIYELPRGLVSVASDTVQARIVPTLGDSQPLFGYALSGAWGSFYRYPDLVGDNGAWITPPGTTSNVVVNARAASAETWVDGSYAGDDSDGTEDKPYTTIQDAVDNTAAYGLVHVAPGTYNEGGVTLTGHDVASRVGIETQVAIRATGSAEETIIEGGENTRCVAVRRQAVAAHIRGFTLRNGIADYGTTDANGLGGGFYATPQSWQNMTNSASANFAYLPNAQVTDCIFTGNSARQGSAICGGWAQRCVFTGNVASENDRVTQSFTGNNYIRGAVAYHSVLSACLVTNNVQTADKKCSAFYCLPYNVTFAESATCSDGKTVFRPIDQNTPTYNCAFFGGYIDVNRPTGTIATVGDIGDTSLTFISDWISIYRTRKLFIDAPAGDLHLRPVTDAYTKGDGSAYCADKFAVGDFEGNALAYVDGNPIPGAYSTLVGPAEDPFVLTIR